MPLFQTERSCIHYYKDHTGKHKFFKGSFIKGKDLECWNSAGRIEEVQVLDCFIACWLLSLFFDSRRGWFFFDGYTALRGIFSA